MSDNSLSELDRMMIEWTCTRLIYEFAQLNDASDFEPLAALFTEDGVFARPTMPDKPMVGRATILEQFRQRPARTLRHITATPVITVESPTSARGVSYMVLYNGPPKAAGEIGGVKAEAQLVGTFHDRFVKVDGQWLFAERQGSLQHSAT